MLDIRVTVEGGKAVIEGLERMREDFPGAVVRGLTRVVEDAHGKAYALLSGEGAKGTSERRTSRTGRRYLKWKKRRTQVPAGGYPVPVRTGHLRSRLDYVAPGESKASEGLTFTAGPFEAVLFDSAEYANPIHEGTGSSERFGPRPFITDGAEAVDIVGIMEDEAGKVIR